MKIKLIDTVQDFLVTATLLIAKVRRKLNWEKVKKY